MPTLDRFCAVGMGAIRASGCAPFIVLVVLAGCGAKPSGITALRRQELLDQQPLSAWTELDAAHPGERLKDPRTGIVFRRIPAGEFVMGSSFITFAQPQHPVRISKPFLLAETELTLNQWRAFLADTGVPALAENWRGADALPAAIDHNGAALYCALYGYQIPTEAQWEWACLGGLSPSDPCWESADFLRQHAVYHLNAGDHARPVASLLANGYGLYDMLGNMWEWCADWSAPYGTESQVDPTGPAAPFGVPPIGSGRVLRGCSWFTAAPAPMPQARIWDERASTTSVVSFRPSRAID